MKWLAILCFAWNGSYHVERVHDITTKEACVSFVQEFNKRLGGALTSNFAYCVPEDRSLTGRIEVEK